jgi:hypothetical protein
MENLPLIFFLSYYSVDRKKYSVQARFTDVTASLSAIVPFLCPLRVPLIALSGQWSTKLPEWTRLRNFY